LSLMFDSKEMAMKYEGAINAAQRTKEARARQYLEARANNDDNIVNARKERKESGSMREEHLFSLDAEIVFEEISLIAREKVWEEYERKALEDIENEKESDEKALKQIRNPDMKEKRRSSIAVNEKAREIKKTSLEVCMI
jgi:hypothetical protein